jgi:hypothetical protein
LQKSFEVCQGDDTSPLPSNIKPSAKVVEIVVADHLLFALNQCGVCAVFNLCKCLQAYSSWP